VHKLPSKVGFRLPTGERHVTRNRTQFACKYFYLLLLSPLKFQKKILTIPVPSCDLHKHSIDPYTCKILERKYEITSSMYILAIKLRIPSETANIFCLQNLNLKSRPQHGYQLTPPKLYTVSLNIHDINDVIP
jgi:hypothetical protein